jgi:GR25 family glycosyltransferase involved in LPS biosynthesis
MENLFQDEVFFGKPIQRIAAVDGKNDAVFDKLELTTKRNTKLEYACLLSHLKAIKTFSESTYENALIFEDDITLEFKQYWRRSLRDIIENAPSDWEIIQLCYITSGTLYSDYTLNNYKKNRYGGIASMAAYIINKKAAQKLINETYNNFTEKYTLINYHTHEADHYLYKCLKTYTYKYPYFIYPTENTSTLHPEDLNSHVRSKMQIERMYQYKF